MLSAFFSRQSTVPIPPSRRSISPPPLRCARGALRPPFPLLRSAPLSLAAAEEDDSWDSVSPASSGSSLSGEEMDESWDFVDSPSKAPLAPSAPLSVMPAVPQALVLGSTPTTCPPEPGPPFAVTPYDGGTTVALPFDFNDLSQALPHGSVSSADIGTPELATDVDENSGCWHYSQITDYDYVRIHTLRSISCWTYNCNGETLGFSQSTVWRAVNCAPYEPGRGRHPLLSDDELHCLVQLLSASAGNRRLPLYELA
jgi:hypothetical protein